MKRLEPHPLAALLPMMSESDYQALKADVVANGKFNEAAKTFQGKLLDGRNRDRVSAETGIALPTEEFKGTEAEAVRYVYSKAVHRNMTDSQKAAAAVNFLPHFEAAASERQKAALKQGSRSGTISGTGIVVSGDYCIDGLSLDQWEFGMSGAAKEEIAGFYKAYVDGEAKDNGGRSAKFMAEKVMSALRCAVEAAVRKGESRDFAGSLFGVSGRYVQDAKKIFEADKKLFQSIFEGRETVSRAKLQLARSQRTAHAKAATKSFRRIDPAQCEIITGDALKEMEKLPRGKFRLIFADPPYNLGFSYDADPTKDALPPIKYSHLTGGWIKKTAELLTPDGTLCWMIPEEHVADVRDAIGEAGLHVRRLIVWHESFGQSGKNNFGRTCRFIWYATKSKTDFVFDAGAILVPSDRATKYGDKRAMEGGKVPDALWDFSRVAGTFSERIPDEGIPTQLPVELVKRAVRCFTEVGDTVCDPFGGTGTTARAALSCGRKCVTIERSKKYAAIIKRELAAMSATEGK